MSIITTLGLFALTALAELLGCWLVWYWLRGGASAAWLLPAALCLTAFAWLLTLHPTASGRVYAAYGGVYVLGALAWLRWVDGARLTTADLAGSALILAGCMVIVWGFRAA
jgi:small multidrug resistance family-3 protein